MIYSAAVDPHAASSPTSPIARASPTTSASAPTSARRASAGPRRSRSAATGTSTLALAERDGRAVRGLKVEGVLGRPVDQPLRRQARARRDGAGPLRGAGGGARRRQLADRARGARADGRRADLPHAEAPMAQAMTHRRPSRRRAHRAPAPAADDAPHPVTTVLAVENMHCGGCMRKVEAALAAVPGVASARANLSARRVTAVHGAAGVNAADLVEALARAGFKAAELAEEAASPAQAGRPGSAEAARRRRLRRRQHHAAVGLGVVGRAPAT